jgi:hypothetical protein
MMPFDFVQVTRIGAGQGASLHCLQQAWKIWDTSDSDIDPNIAKGLFLRAFLS